VPDLGGGQLPRASTPKGHPQKYYKCFCKTINLLLVLHTRYIQFSGERTKKVISLQTSVNGPLARAGGLPPRQGWGAFTMTSAPGFHNPKSGARAY